MFYKWREGEEWVESRVLMKQLNKFFESTNEVPRIRVGQKQALETLINENALLFAKFLRDEIEVWNPRITIL
jgi:hypothetical protein